MRAVATALVLIAGAAVILWYGSTLNNSWVLGGLIGGLAALLLSIPISLTLFSHLSRRHDEHLQMEEEAEARLAHEYTHRMLPSRRNYEVEGEGYAIREVDEDEYEEDEVYRRQEDAERRGTRRLPDEGIDVVHGLQRQIKTRQGTSAASGKLLAPRSQAYLPVPRPQPQPSHTQTEKTSRRETRVLRNASLNSMSQHRMEALRTARLEAARASTDDGDVSTTRYSRQERLRSSHDTSRKPLERDEIKEPQETRHEARTDYIENRPPQTGSIRRTPQTEQVTKRPKTRDLHVDMASNDEENEDMSHIDIHRPLIRRAPYMYTDDSLRQQLAKQVDPPAVRRSSRQEALQENEDFF